MAPVGKHPLRLGQFVEQGCRTGASLIWPTVMKKLKGRPLASVTA